MTKTLSYCSQAFYCNIGILYLFPNLTFAAMFHIEYAVEPETFAGENFREFRGIASFRESFIREFLCAGTRRACGRGEFLTCTRSKFVCYASSPRSVEDTAVS